MSRFVYKTTHPFFCFFLGGGTSTTLIASSNTVFNPRWVRAEHSKYLAARISFAIARAVSTRKGQIVKTRHFLITQFPHLISLKSVSSQNFVIKSDPPAWVLRRFYASDSRRKLGGPYLCEWPTFTKQTQHSRYM